MKKIRDLTKEEIALKVKENQERQIRAVHEIVQTAWEQGIEIREIHLQNNFEQEIGPFFYGDRINLPASNLKEIETDMGIVKLS